MNNVLEMRPKQDSSVAATMVVLKLSHWAGKKLDKNVSKEVNDKYHTKDVGRFHKDLVAKEFLKPITQKVTQIRKFHYTNTLTGLASIAMLPNTNYLDYMNEMADHKREFEALCQTFLDYYPQAVHEAKQNLQGLFNSDDYPEFHEMQRKFNFELQILPLPTSMDWAGDLGIDSELDAVTPMIEAAAKELWLRLSTTISTLHERLDDKDSIVRQSLVDNLIEITDVLPKLNFTGNKALDSLAQQASQQAKSLDMESVRKNEDTRSQAADDIKDIMDKVSAYM
jgi:predicted ATPase